MEDPGGRIHRGLGDQEGLPQEERGDSGELHHFLTSLLQQELLT